MIMKNRSDSQKLKGVPGKIRKWLVEHRIPPRLLFILTGIISSVWFLARVIPKPSRATNPCMKVAAPLMSGFVIYLLSIAGSMVAFRKARNLIARSRYTAASLVMLAAIAAMAVSLTKGDKEIYASVSPATGPDDGPNQPFGTARGVNPGRVVWIWNPKQQMKTA
jgi:cation transport ATPase